MPVDINYFLERKVREFQPTEVIITEDLYIDIPDENLRELFAIMHHNFNSLFSFMYRKTNGHFNAVESRQLINNIKLYEETHHVLRSTTLAFDIETNYQNLITQCKDFLTETGGSPIPNDLPKIDLLEYEPIFYLSQTVKVESSNEQLYPSQMIGDGSYANVYKYTDGFYRKKFAYKKAKPNLTAKELERFKLEYNTMLNLNSPYILEVYGYDETLPAYYMEYVDETLYSYITKNNTKIMLSQRVIIAKQIFKALNYIHTKSLLHRDISFTNVLLKHYEDTIVVKLSDFGLVKIENSTLTSFGSEVKGSLNDSNLQFIGFDNYSIEYETYALTRLILFVMTGKHSIDKISNTSIREFVLKGINPNLGQRYKSILDIEQAFSRVQW